MKLLIAGDLAPTQSNQDLFKQGDTYALLGKELLYIWHAADIRIINLEVPITDIQESVPKHGPSIAAPASTIHGIKALRPSLLGLANNHILDQGEQGLQSCQNLLRSVDIPFVGAGENLEEARAPHIFTAGKAVIGVYACAEHEFSIVGQNFPGANPFDPLKSLEQIHDLKMKCDYVVVLYHGGKEHYRYPSPDLQKVCRSMAQKGADVIVCQHSHCIGCAENYKDAVIVYGQGNFIFDHSDSAYWQTSMLIMIDLKDGLKVDYIPIVKKRNVIRLAGCTESEEILSAFHQRSAEILQPGFVEKAYQRLAAQHICSYLRRLSGQGRILSILDRYIFGERLLKLRFKNKDLLAVQNYIECESHRELLLAGLKGINERNNPQK